MLPQGNAELREMTAQESEFVRHLPFDTLQTYDPSKTEMIGGEARPSTPRTRYQDQPSSSGYMEGVDPGFVLRQIIGQGGNGEIWEAEQPSLGRRVAVKKLRAEHYDSYADDPGKMEAMEYAFRQEAIATACLEHPNIVPIHTFELDKHGQPMLAMKLVRGTSWHSLIYDSFQTLSTPDMLSVNLPILVDVCQAVAFAHSRGIIHRDLKPGQVMVGEFGEVALMDWGLAIALDSTDRNSRDELQISDLPRTTTASSPAGTVAFMAPEQTRATAEGIGPWTDIYLLGGILYLLLTGQPPHPAESRERAYFQAVNGYVAPPRHAAGSRDVPQDLEECAMKALSIEPANRQASVAEFLGVIQDHLSGATRRRQSLAILGEVRMALPSAGSDYRRLSDLLGKVEYAQNLWAENRDAGSLRQDVLARHARSAISNGDLVLATSTLGRIEDDALVAELRPTLERATAAQAAQRRQRRIALVSTFVLALALAVGSLIAYRTVSADRDAISKARQGSEDLVQFMMTDLRERLAPIDPDLRMLGPAADKAIAHYYAQPIETLSRDELANIFNGLMDAASILASQGNVIGSNEAHEKRLEMLEIAERRFPGDLKWSRDRLASARQIARNHKDRGDSHAGLGIMLKYFPEVEPLLAANPQNENAVGEAAAYYSEMGATYINEDDFKLAIQYAKRAVEIAENFAGKPSEQTERSVFISKNILGYIYSRAEMNKEAEVVYRETLELAKAIAAKNPTARSESDVSVAEMTLAQTATRIGKMEEAGSYMESAQGHLVEILKKYGANAIYARAYATNAVELGRYYVSIGNIPAADRTIAEALKEVSGYRLRDPENTLWISEQSDLLEASSIVALAKGDIEARRAALKDSLELARLSYKLRPDLRESVKNLVSILGSNSDVQGELNDGDTARALLQEGLDALAKYYIEYPENLDTIRERGVLLARLGMSFQDDGLISDAEVAYLESTAIARKVAAEGKESHQLLRDLAVGESRMAEIYMAGDKGPEALTAFLATLKAFEMVLEKYPGKPMTVIETAMVRVRAARMFEWNGKLDEAAKYYADGLASLSDSRAKGHLSLPGLCSDYLVAYYRGAYVALLQGKKDEWRKEADASVTAADEIVAQFPENKNLRRLRVEAYLMRGEGRRQTGDTEGAIADIKFVVPDLDTKALDTIDPDDRITTSSLIRANHLMGRVLVDTGRAAEAKPFLMRAREFAHQSLTILPAKTEIFARIECVAAIRDAAPEEAAPLIKELRAKGLSHPDIEYP